jgi:hypothetical protein
VLWYPSQWDDRNTGQSSVGLGRDARAYGAHSTAIGDAAIADAQYSVALVQGYATAMAAVSIGRGGGARGPAAFSSGLQTDANGPTSVALGTNVRAPSDAPGSFVFGDYSTLAEYRMVGGANQFNVRANSFVEFFSNAAATVGVRLDSGSWNSTSDRRLKQHFRPLSGERVLAKLARLPIREWNYTRRTRARHLGPAQDSRPPGWGIRAKSAQWMPAAWLAALKASPARIVAKARRDRWRGAELMRTSRPSAA